MSALSYPDYAKLHPRPTGWREVKSPLNLPDMISLGAFVRTEGFVPRNPLTCLVSVDLMDAWDSGHWLHLSIARRKTMPSWADLCHARDEFGYGDRLFVQLMPAQTAWLNLHNYCLHLFHRLDAETVPRLLWDQEGATGSHYGARAPFPGG